MTRVKPPSRRVPVAFIESVNVESRGGGRLEITALTITLFERIAGAPNIVATTLCGLLGACTAKANVLGNDSLAPCHSPSQGPTHGVHGVPGVGFRMRGTRL